jgi:hypothetical protein
VSAGFAARCPWWSYQVARIRLIVGLITPHRIYLTIMKPVKEAKARSRAVVPLQKKKKKKKKKKYLKQITMKTYQQAYKENQSSEDMRAANS